MCTVNDEFAGNLRRARRAPSPGRRVSDARGELAGSARPSRRPGKQIDQLEPEPFVGSVITVSATPFASPAPLFQTVRVKPIGSPPITWAESSAVFTMWIVGAATQVEAFDWPEPALVVVTLPVLLTVPVPGQVPPVAAVVGEVM